MTLVGVGALMILRDPSQTWLLYVYVIFFGIGFGSRAVIFSALTADIFSGKGFDQFSAIQQSLSALAERWVPGWGAHSMTGPAAILVSFGLSAVVLGCSDVCIWLASMPSIANRDERLFGSNT